MDVGKKIGRFAKGSLLVLIVAASCASTGCAVYSNGMTLPNPYYLENRVQYFPRGPEFPFTNEAANMQETQPDRSF